MGEELSPMERVGRYEIVLPIAKGGMATVYLARAESMGGFDKYVALKLTAKHLRDDPEFAAHLIEEAKLVAHLRHVHVVSVLDVGQGDKGVFLVMEYVPGDSLAGLMRRAREAGTTLPRRVALRALVEALAGLHAAYEHADEDGHPLHLVHRDFSPQNILVGTDGVTRLTDFGIAKAASRASVTRDGHIKGKISYVAPEQARGREVDRRSDIWSAGVIAWEILAGRKLHGKTAEALVDIAKKEPPRVKTVAPDVSDALDDAIASVLKLDPDARTPTAQAFARALAAAAREANLLAETDEVAAEVARLAGAALAERKSKVAEVRRQRAISSPEINVTEHGVPPVAPVRRPLPSLPDVPPPGEDVQESLLDVSVLLAEEPAPSVSAEPAAAPPPPPPSPPSEPSIFASDDAFSSSSPIVSPLAPPVRDAGGRSLASVATSIASLAPALSRGRLVLAIAGAAGFAVLVAVVLLILSWRRDGSPSEGEPLAASAASTASPSAPSQASPALAPPSTIGTAPGAAQIDDGPPMLEVTADTPITAVRLEGRTIDAVVPAPTIRIELEEGEEHRLLHVVALCAGGRAGRTTAAPGDHEVRVACDADAPPEGVPQNAPRAPAPRVPPPRRR